MRKLIGTFCIILGTICLLGAVGFVIYNHLESKNAANTTQSMLENVQHSMDDGELLKSEDPDALQNDDFFENANVPTGMAIIKVDGYDCIGILSIPVLDLELPVLTEWSYTKLKKAPCLYYGTYYEKDFVIAAHNYEAHFGRLSELQKNDTVIFTDVNGVSYQYEVVLLETLPKEATEEMITSGFDLSLYTCTTGGGNRVTVRCNIKEKNQ